MDVTKEPPFASDKRDERIRDINRDSEGIIKGEDGGGGDRIDTSFPEHLQRRDDPFRFLKPGQQFDFRFLDQPVTEEKDIPSLFASRLKACSGRQGKTNFRLAREVEKLEKDLGNKLAKKLEKIEEEQNQQLHCMWQVEDFLFKIMLEDRLGELSLARVKEFFSELGETLSHEYYESLDLSDAACSLALPLFTKMFQDWDPLRNPSSEHQRYLSTWKEFLQSEELYTKLVSQVVLPAVEVSAISTWDAARDPEPMLKFLESWDELLPSLVIVTIIDRVILPKLISAVNSWVPPCQNSTTDAVPVHVWVHPWLPLLERHGKLECLRQMILKKLMNILNAWPPGDFSPDDDLAPWETVLDQASWHQLCNTKRAEIERRWVCYP